METSSSGPTSPGARGPQVSRRDAAFAATAGFLGWTLDAFDLFLVVIALPSIAQDFHVEEAAIAVIPAHFSLKGCHRKAQGNALGQ
jgi:hypothetical protein